jgi:hypothetical protein
MSEGSISKNKFRRLKKGIRKNEKEEEEGTQKEISLDDNIKKPEHLMICNCFEA